MIGDLYCRRNQKSSESLSEGIYSVWWPFAESRWPSGVKSKTVLSDHLAIVANDLRFNREPTFEDIFREFEKDPSKFSLRRESKTVAEAEIQHKNWIQLGLAQEYLSMISIKAPETFGQFKPIGTYNTETLAAMTLSDSKLSIDLKLWLKPIKIENTKLEIWH